MILKAIADESIREAQKLEEEFIAKHAKSHTKLRQSIDGACPNRARMKSRLCYMYVFNQMIKKVTDYGF